jgi:hypothetical protein
MSFMHMEATTAASASQAIVSLQNISVHNATWPSANAGVKFFGDGQAWDDDGGGENFLYNWIDPADETILPGVIPWQIMRSNTVGDEPFGPNEGVWTEIVTSNDLGLPNTTNGGTGYANGQTVSMDQDGAVIGIGGNAATMLTQNVSLGVVPTSLGLASTDVGKYYIAPNGARSTTVVNYSGGTGSNLASYARFNGIEWGLGTGYPFAEYCTFDISIRKGTGPVLATASVELDADAS